MMFQLNVSPAMATSITNCLWQMEDVMAMLEAWDAAARYAASRREKHMQLN